MRQKSAVRYFWPIVPMPLSANSGAKPRKAARAQDARRKIVAGALALEHTIRNPGSEFARILTRLLDEYARPHERFLFDDLLPGPCPAPDGGTLVSDVPIVNAAESISAE
jgi:hypothetical protein